MGSIVSASYPCGFEEEGLALGGGMRDFATRCSLPALCTDCGAFQVANSKAKRPRCSWCQGSLRFYTDPALYTERGKMRKMTNTASSMSTGTMVTSGCHMRSINASMWGENDVVRGHRAVGLTLGRAWMPVSAHAVIDVRPHGSKRRRHTYYDEPIRAHDREGL